MSLSVHTQPCDSANETVYSLKEKKNGTVRESILASTDIRISHHILNDEYRGMMKGRALTLSSSILSDSSIYLLISEIVIKESPTLA